MTAIERRNRGAAKLLAAAAAGAIWAAPAAAVPVVSLDVDTAVPADVGSTIELTLRAQDMPDFDGFQIDLTYDTDLVSYIGGVFNSGFDIEDDQLDDAQAAEPGASGNLTIFNLTAGVDTFFAQNPPLSGDLDVITLSFTALAPGTAVFEVGGTGDIMFSNLGSLVFDDTQFASVLIVDPTGGGGGTVIPLPASAFFLLAGMGGIAGLRRLRR